MRLSNPPPEANWRVCWRLWRNRVMASHRFHQFVSRAPLLRSVARRRARALFDLVAGFSYSQIVLAAVETGLIDRLASGPVSNDDIAEQIDLPVEAVSRLLKAAAAVGLVERVGANQWMLASRGALLQANAGAQAMVRHHRLFYDDLRDPVVLLRNDRAAPTALSSFWRYAAGAHAAEYSELMAASQHLVSEQVIGAYSFARHRAVLDIGGGHGSFATAIARAYPELRLGLFDLPSVLAGTVQVLAEKSISERVTLHGGDFFADPIPAGYDCMTLVRILHDHDDERALELLRNIRQSLAPGGRLLIAEPMAGTRGAEAMGDGYFGLYLWAMGSGRPRRPDEIGEMLADAGFQRWRSAPTAQPIVASLIVAST